jgi:hypothetical protein
VKKHAEIPVPAHITFVADRALQIRFLHGQDISQYLGELHTGPHIKEPVHKHYPVTPMTMKPGGGRVL